MERYNNTMHIAPGTRRYVALAPTPEVITERIEVIDRPILTKLPNGTEEVGTEHNTVAVTYMRNGDILHTPIFGHSTGQVTVQRMVDGSPTLEAIGYIYPQHNPTAEEIQQQARALEQAAR